MNDPTELERLSHVLALGEQGDWPAVWELLDAWDSPPLEAWIALFLFGDPAGALEGLVSEGSRVAIRLGVDLAQRAGLEPEAQRALDRLLETAPDADLLQRAALPRVRARAWESARPLLEKLVAISDRAEHRRALAECLEGLGHSGAVDAWLAVARDEPDVARRGLVRLAAFDELRRHDATMADDTESLWRGAPREDCPDPCARAARARMDGDLDVAHQRALAATAAEPERSEAWTWLGEIELARGEVESGRLALDRALGLAGRFHLPALLLRLTSEMEVDLLSVNDGTLRDPVLDGPLQLASEIREALTELWGRDRLATVTSLDQVVAILQESLARLGGNRTPDATYVHEGMLRRFQTRQSPREASRRALELIRVLPIEDVEHALERVAARYPNSESPIVHRGELDLWLGRYDAAAAWFRRAIEMQEGTRWAYIGLGGCAMLQGDLEESMRVHRRGVRIMGSEIGSIFIYRGETHLRAGRFRDARRDLEEAKRLSPTRVSAWLNLALLHLELGNEDEARTEVEPLLHHAPVWLGDAGGRALFAGDFASVARHLTHARDLALGNRSSSCQTYVNQQGTLRLVQRPGPNVGIRRDALLRGLRRRIQGGGADRS